MRAQNYLDSLLLNILIIIVVVVVVVVVKDFVEKENTMEVTSLFKVNDDDTIWPESWIYE